MNYLIILMLVVMYEVGRITLGLAVHPYRTMREVARDKWEWPLALVPVGLLIGSLIMGRIGAGLVEVPEWGRTEVAVILAALMAGLLMWQAVVGYLGVRFWLALKNR
jgi:hypothetical protein